MKGFAILARRWTSYYNPDAGHDIEGEAREGDYTRRITENAVQLLRDNGVLAVSCPWEVLGSETSMTIDQQMAAAKTYLEANGADETVFVLVQCDELDEEDDRNIIYDLRSTAGLAVATTIAGVDSASPIDDNQVIACGPLLGSYLEEAFEDLDPAFLMSDAYGVIIRMLNVGDAAHADLKTPDGLDACSTWLAQACQAVA